MNIGKMQKLLDNMLKDPELYGLTHEEVNTIMGIKILVDGCIVEGFINKFRERGYCFGL